MDQEALENAIAKVEQTLRSVGLLDMGFADEVQLLAWNKSTSSDGPKIKLLLNNDDAVDPFAMATIRKGSGKTKIAGQRYYLFAIPLDYAPEVSHGIPAPGSEALVSDTPKPYGKEASELYRCGFFYAPPVLNAIGTDDDLVAYIQTLNCIVCGGHDWVEEIGQGRCEAAHVNNASNSGTGIKADYSRVPMCHHDHTQVQHQHGESQCFVNYMQATKTTFMGGDEDLAREAKVWFEKNRVKYLMEWASKKLAVTLGEVSMGYVEPSLLVQWCEAQSIKQYLPRRYYESV